MRALLWALLAIAPITLGSSFTNFAKGFSDYDMKVDGPWCVVTATGSAYIYNSPDGGAWSFMGEIIGQDTTANDDYGLSIAVSSSLGLVAVGAPRWSRRIPALNISNYQTGAVYIFSLTTRQQIQQIIAPTPESHLYFGRGLAMDGDELLVGAPTTGVVGACNSTAIIFKWSPASQKFIVEATLVPTIEAQAEAMFGLSVALDGNLAVVGAHTDGPFISLAGAAYVFSRNQGGPNVWGLVKQLHPPPDDSFPADFFGTSVAVSGDIVIVGKQYDSVNATNSGSAYVFQANNGGIGTFGFLQKLTPRQPAAKAQFGTTLSVYNLTLAVGAPYLGSGTIFAYQFNGGFYQENSIYAVNASSDAEIGITVAVSSDDTILAGSGIMEVFVFNYVPKPPVSPSSSPEIIPMLTIGGSGNEWLQRLIIGICVVIAWTIITAITMAIVNRHHKKRAKARALLAAQGVSLAGGAFGDIELEEGVLTPDWGVGSPIGSPGGSDDGETGLISPTGLVPQREAPLSPGRDAPLFPYREAPQAPATPAEKSSLSSTGGAPADYGTTRESPVFLHTLPDGTEIDPNNSMISMPFNTRTPPSPLGDRQRSASASGSFKGITPPSPSSNTPPSGSNGGSGNNGSGNGSGSNKSQASSVASGVATAASGVFARRNSEARASTDRSRGTPPSPLAGSRRERPPVGPPPVMVSHLRTPTLEPPPSPRKSRLESSRGTPDTPTAFGVVPGPLAGLPMPPPPSFNISQTGSVTPTTATGTPTGRQAFPQEGTGLGLPMPPPPGGDQEEY